MKVLLSVWAAKRYDPAPSDWVLRKWVRNGEIFPAPELVGKKYYVDESARRQFGDMERRSLVERLTAA
jgi:hypothetical protein